MTGKKKPPADIVGVPLEKALARFLKTNSTEIAEEFANIKARKEEILKDGEERKKLIQRAGRPAGKRFRL